MQKKPKWTGSAVKRMWENDVSRSDIAEELGFSTVYVGKLFRGLKTPKNAEEMVNNAINTVIAKRALQERGETK